MVSFPNDIGVEMITHSYKIPQSLTSFSVTIPESVIQRIVRSAHRMPKWNTFEIRIHSYSVAHRLPTPSLVNPKRWVPSLYRKYCGQLP